MLRTARQLAPLALAAGLLALGCDTADDDAINETPDEVLAPEAAPADDLDAADVDADIPETAPPTEAMPPADDAEDDEASLGPLGEDATTESPPIVDEPAETIEPEPADAEQATVPDVEVVPLGAEEGDPASFAELIAGNDAEYTLVDCWASWCEPCKENFPHLIDMAEAYSDDGLAVIALSFDAGTEVPELDEKQIAAAEEFLADKDLSGVGSYRIDGLVQYEMFDRFDVGTIPAVFIYDGMGNEVARFTYDDPDNQFTYAEVEQKVADLLGVEPEGVVEAEGGEDESAD